MPSSIIHYSVGKLVLEKTDMFKDEHDIFLYSVGLIAPDSWRNCQRFKDSPLPKIEKRKFSHFSNDGTWSENYDLFYKKYKDYLDNPFMVGYFVHLITDRNWRNDMFYNCFCEDGSIKLLNGTTINGVNGVRKQLLQSESVKMAVLLAKKFKLQELQTLTDEEIKSLPKMDELEFDGLNKTISYHNSEINLKIDEKLEVYKLEDFVLGIDNCSNFIIEELKKYNILKKEVDFF